MRRRISVIADAQRGQLYVADYVREPAGRLVAARACQIEPLAAWLARLEPGTVVLGPASIHPASAAPSRPGSSFPIPHSIIPTGTA